MMEPQLPPRPGISAGPRASSALSGVSTPTVDDANIADQYEQLLGKIALAEDDFEIDGIGGRSVHLEEASGIVFDLLYRLDFKTGGELVPRLAGLYGYIANELLNVGKTRDKAQLAHLRDMIKTLRESWYGAQGSSAPPR